jgi:hypothetical protein
MVRLFLWTAPIAYYGASLMVLADHGTAMLVWLVCVMLAGALLTTRFGARAGFLVWGAIALPLLVWVATHSSTQWLRPGLITVGAVYAIALTAQIHAVLERDDFGKASVAWLHLNALLMFAGAYILIEPIRVSATAALAAGFAAWHGVLAIATLGRRRDWGLHFAGVAFTLLMIAIGLQFDGATMTIGWAAEGAIVVALGLRERRDWLRLGGAVLFLVALVRTVDLLTSVAPIDTAVLFNARTACAAFVVLLCYALAWLHHRDGEAPEDAAIAIAIFLVAAQLLTLMLLTSEINAYWAARQDSLTREFAKSVTWALYATALIVVGLKREYAPIRYFAIAVFALTTLKVFAVDLAQLERVYRILSIIGLGIALLVTSWLYQRARRSS